MSIDFKKISDNLMKMLTEEDSKVDRPTKLQTEQSSNRTIPKTDPLLEKYEKQLLNNKLLVERMKEIEEQLMKAFDFLITLCKNVITQPEEMCVNSTTFEPVSFNFKTSEVRTLSKSTYTVSSILGFLDESQKTLTRYSFEDQVIELLNLFEMQQKSSKATSKKMANFKDSLTSSCFEQSLGNLPPKSVDMNFTFSKPETIPPAEQKKPKDKFSIVRVKFNFTPEKEKDLAIKKGEFIEVLSMNPEGWWYGRNLKNDCKGYFPSNFVEMAE